MDEGDEVMENAAGMVEFLGLALGENCELVLQDLREGKQRVRAIANGHISGRVPGAPPTALARKMIRQGVWKKRDWVLNYRGKAGGGRVLRSSTFFIKGGGKLLGMLSVNIDSGEYARLSRSILRLGGLHPSGLSEGAGVPAEEPRGNRLQAAFDELGLAGKPAAILDQEERLRVTEKLLDRGVFQVRGSVAEAAKVLGCSAASLYRYIQTVRSRRAGTPGEGENGRAR